MKKIQIISLRVIALFVTAMLVSFIPELVPDFFGDWVCEGSKYTEGKYYFTTGCDYGGTGNIHNPTNHWGYRHWLFFSMGIVLFIIQIVDIISYCDKKE